MHVAAANGIHIHYRDEGPRAAPTIVFSNSLGTDQRIWDRLIERLGDGFRFVRYDKRGHGLSTAPDAPYALDDHIGDLEALLGQLGIEQAIVCGLSVGGMIAQGLAARHPNRVRALILCDTAEKIGPPEMWEQRIEMARQGGIEALADAVMQRWFSEDFRANRQAELAAWRAMLTRTPAEGYIGTSYALRDADLTQSSAELGVPTLCIGGSEDGATTPEMVQALADLVPGARFVLIEGAGHLPCIESPDAVHAAIDGFLKENALV